MLRVFDMIEEEILALADEQIDKLIDYECALEGAPMLPPDPGPKPKKDIPAPDIRGFNIAGVYVLDAEHAGRILEAINSGNIFTTEYGRNYDVQFLSPISENSYHSPKIEPKQLYSSALWDSIKGDQSSFAEQEKEWERRKNIYNKAVEERSSLTTKVWEYIEDLRSHAYQRDQIRKEFGKYLELAENNSTIAFNFLEKVKDLSDFPELKKEFCPDV